MFAAKPKNVVPRYLRLSVTDACNFRCVYCLPNGCRQGTAPQTLLSGTEIRQLIIAMARQGIQKVRITGGEPGLRTDLLDIVATTASTPGITWTALTTNGTALAPTANMSSAERARSLRQAGLRSLNLSIDSLDPVMFTKLSGSTSYRQVLDSLDAALEAGFDAVKVNCVLLRDRNDNELEKWLDFVRGRSVSVRFIELMPTQGSTHLYQGSYASAQPIVLRLQRDGWTESPRTDLSGPAREFYHPDYKGRIGVIAPISGRFCESCNRLRVTSDGRLHLCAFTNEGHPLRHLLGSAIQQRELSQSISELLAQKTQGCESGILETESFARSFSTLGG